MDTYNANHACTVGLLTNASVGNAAGEYTSPSEFASGNNFDIVVTYSAKNNTLQATIEEIKFGGALSTYTWTGVNLRQWLGCPPGTPLTDGGCFAWVGFSAGTGGSTERHQVLAHNFMAAWPSESPTPSLRCVRNRSDR